MHETYGSRLPLGLCQLNLNISVRKAPAPDVDPEAAEPVRIKCGVGHVDLHRPIGIVGKLRGTKLTIHRVMGAVPVPGVVYSNR